MPVLDTAGLVDALRTVVRTTLPEVTAVPEALTTALFAQDGSGANPLTMPFVVILAGDPRADYDTGVRWTSFTYPVEFLYIARTDGDGVTDTTQSIREKLDLLAYAFRADYHLTLGGPDPCGRVTMTEVVAPAMNRTNMVAQFMSDSGLPVSAMGLMMEYKVAVPWPDTRPVIDIPAPSTFWGMNQVAGAHETDTVGGVILTAVNSPGSEVGVVSAARTFDGINQFFTAPDQAALQLNVPTTVAGWFKLLDIDAYHFALQKGIDNATHDIEYALCYSFDAGRMVFSIYIDPADSASVGWPVILTLGVWHAFCVKWDGSTIWGAWDGGAFTQRAASGFPRVTAGALLVGSEIGTDDWHGSLDAIAIWKGTLLTDAQWQNFYNAGAGREWRLGIWV